MSNETTSNRPVDKVRVGSVTASIWRNTTEKGVFYNVTFDNRYQDKNGDWKSSDSYGPSDLLALAKAADLAHTKTLELLKGQPEETE